MMYRVRIVLLVMLFLPVLIGLGFWQLERYHVKQDLEDQYEARRTGNYTVADLKGLYDPLYFQLTLTGRFDNSHNFYLDNRTYQGRVGFHILTPFVTDKGDTVIVDRGWIAGIPDRSRLPEVPEVSGLVTIRGQSWLPAGEAFLLEDDVWTESWPKVIQAIDQERMIDALNVKAEPWLLVQGHDQPGSLQKNFHLTNMPPSRHFGYAIQWFSMAAVLVLLGLWALRKNNNNKNAVTQE
ncbi:SURF1 family protein [Sansalvadorimonas verongulae]|nr:SURF1 family protein [Sansalvadorimonas verongulae]